MPRCARVKSFDSVYHIMIRSISDTPLFKDSSDKDRYLKLIKKYQGIYLFKVYAYCLMDTHGHIIIDCAGADISKIMHCINQSYAQYFNYKYGRRGHLFQDRFKSKIVYDDTYLINLTAYIHTNPHVIKPYEGREEAYKYLSYGIYLGLREDIFNIVDIDFVLDQFSKDRVIARKDYIEFIKKFNKEEFEEEMEFRHERAEYRSERRILVRNVKPGEVVEFVSSYTKENTSCINIKYLRKNVEMKSLCALLMRGLCGMSQKAICGEMGNISQTQASRLSLKGYNLINEKPKYRNIINDFLQKRAS
jgi:REP element-mobilizing transposase RayT